MQVRRPPFIDLYIIALIYKFLFRIYIKYPIYSPKPAYMNKMDYDFVIGVIVWTKVKSCL